MNLSELPQSYIVQKFYQYAGYPRFKQIANVYEAGCPICHEGKSWGKRRRLYYLVKENKIKCHNCGWSGGPAAWIIEAGGMEPREIYRELREEDYGYLDIDKFGEDTSAPIEIETLPANSINLFDPIQINYYKSNKFVAAALQYIRDRRLYTAVNRPKALWISLEDFVHKNRLIIPFYDENGKILYYQSRMIMEGGYSDEKYLSKLNGNRSIFNFDLIDNSCSYLFIFEGPIDSFFIKNGIAIAGINEKSHDIFTPQQKEQLRKMWFMEKIFVLDSQWQDNAALLKSKSLADSNQNVFVWPREEGLKYKDINEKAVAESLNEIDIDFILKDVHKGLRAKVRLSAIK